jgi:hypothetical protein
MPSVRRISARRGEAEARTKEDFGFSILDFGLELTGAFSVQNPTSKI